MPSLKRLFTVHDMIVRCRKGHLYHTLWWPLGSFKAVRWFKRRFQWCPAGHHWSRVTPVTASSLTPDEKTSADRYYDIRIP